MKHALKKLQPPDPPFLTLEDLKLHSRIDTGDDDALITMMMLAVIDWCESVTGRTLGETKYQMTFDAFPHGNKPILLPRSPIISLDAINYLDLDNTSQTLQIGGSTPGVIFNITGREPERVAPVYSTYWPRALPVIDACNIQFTAGYADDSDSKVSAIKLICCKMVASWYEFREPLAAHMSVQDVPGLTSFQALLGSYVIYGGES